MSYKTAYKDNHAAFEIVDIEYEPDSVGEQPDPIEFVYNAPNITVDTSGRFAVHEIIGGTTVRQKIGEDPVEVSIDGVCREDTARQLDGLRNAKFATIVSNRLTGGQLQVQFAGVSTSPLEDGGAVAISDDSGQFLYSFTISAMEVVVGSSQTSEPIEEDPGAGSTGARFTQ
jgi:hypothetical protein